LEDSPDINNVNDAIDIVNAHLKKGFAFDRTAKVKPLQALVQYLNQHGELTPEALGVELATPSSYVKPPKPHEVWFKDEYICVPAKYWDDFVREVK
jgi:ethanolamine utilization microcompartment shell protein EutL